MSDNKVKKGNPKDVMIDPSNSFELEYAASQTGMSPIQLKGLIRREGSVNLQQLIEAAKNRSSSYQNAG